MKIEMNEAAGVITFVCVLAVVVVVGIALGLAHDCFMVYQYTSHGYTKTTLPGESCAQWVKAEGGTHGEA